MKTQSSEVCFQAEVEPGIDLVLYKHIGCRQRSWWLVDEDSQVPLSDITLLLGFRYDQIAERLRRIKGSSGDPAKLFDQFKPTDGRRRTELRTKKREKQSIPKGGYKIDTLWPVIASSKPIVGNQILVPPGVETI